jgi:hypothetical protein
MWLLVYGCVTARNDRNICMGAQPVCLTHRATERALSRYQQGKVREAVSAGVREL